MATKHALIIGVDKYPNLDKKYELAGCVNDAHLIQSVLIDRFGFAPSNIRSLHDGAATRAAILEQMDDLTVRIERDDIVVFHFSGHGSRRRSTDPEEASGKDSTIMPNDSGRRPKPNTDISDKEINAWLNKLAEKTNNITLIFDCCHSGTITRDAFGGTPRSVEDDDRSLAEMGLEPMTVPAATRGQRGKGGWLAISRSYVVMSGCRDDELSNEYRFDSASGNGRNGALTHFLTGALTTATPGTTYRDVFESTRQQVNSRFPAQHPQIEGTQDREIFGVKDIEPIRFVAVSAVDDHVVTLKGGAAHGLHMDSVWAVYPPGTKTTDGLTPAALLKVSEVGTLTSNATVAESNGEIVVGARCTEHTPSVTQYVSSVDLSAVEAAQAAELGAALKDSALLNIATDDVADYRVYLLSKRTQADASAPLPQIEVVERPTWAVVNAGGELAMPLHEQGSAKAVEHITTNLERLVRYRNALALENPDSQLDVDFNIYVEDDDDQWQLANGGEAVLTSGKDSVSFEIVNRERVPVFFSVLNFGLTGRIKLLFPSNKTSEMLAAGQTVRLGGGTKRLKLSIPKELLADQGTDTLKAFITLDEADFSWLQQEGTRSVGGARSQLKQLFDAAYNGPATRDLGWGDDDEQQGDDQDWKAISRSFVLQRPPQI